MYKFFFIILTCYFCFSSTVEAKPAAGRLNFFNYMSHNFGKVYRGQKLSYSFKFKNSGDADLVLHGVYASCGCVTSNLDSHKVYKPGEEGIIDVTFDTSNFRGKVSKSVVVLSNGTDSRSKSKVIKLDANIEEEIYTTPPVIDFGDIKLSESKKPQKTFDIKRAKKANGIEVKDFIYNKDLLNVSYDSEKERATVELRINETRQIGFIKETIVVVNSSAHLPKLSVLVRANILANIIPSPSYVELGTISEGTSVTKSVSFKSSKPFKITDIKVSVSIGGKNIEDVNALVEVKTVDDNKRLDISMKNMSGDLKGSINGNVLIHSDDPSQLTLNIPFYGFLK